MTAPIRVLIADDEPAARRTIELLLSADPDFQVLGQCADGMQATEAIRGLQPDVVFLDVQMPGRDGFEVVASLPADAVPLIVFVTAYDAYTLRAFDAHAADYLLKPFSDQRFRRTARHVKERLRERAAPDLSRLLAMVRQPERIAIRTSNGMLLLPLNQIEWVEARGDYVRVHTAERMHVVRETISGFAERLGEEFVRIHRSTIVNLSLVREVKVLASGEYSASLESGACCRLSKAGYERLRQVVGI